MSDLPKRELALAGAACAVCCAPLVIGAVAAAPIAAVAVGGDCLVGAGRALSPRVRGATPIVDPKDERAE